MKEYPSRPRFNPQLEFVLELVADLTEAAAETIRLTRCAAAEARRPRRGATLRPGVRTPLWNILATAVRKQFTRRGDKVRLGRILGLPRQRINDLFRGRKHLPDAERTLLLLVWLHARFKGEDPA
jgi:hypothetical protein